MVGRLHCYSSEDTDTYINNYNMINIKVVTLLYVFQYEQLIRPN